MASDGEGPAERAYPYYAGWQVACCAVVFFGLIGSVGVALLPAGYEKVQNGQLPTGVALMVMGVFGIPTLAMSFLSLAAGIRDRISPPLLRVTSTALILPAGARGDPPEDEHGHPLSEEPPHPETIPFAAIRWVKRDGPPFNHVLEVAYGTGEVTLRLEQALMRTSDFNELDAVLRAALPAAFAAAPPDSQTEQL